MKYGKIIYTPPEGSDYTGFLSGVCYVNGKPVSEEEFRREVNELALKKAEELKLNPVDENKQYK